MLRYKKIFVGSGCDNNCLYCPYEERYQKDEREIIKEIKDCDEYGGIEVYGGEPALRDDILKIFQKSKSFGCGRIKLVTNGKILSSYKKTEQFVKEGCLLYEIKLWGADRQLHDKLTRTKDSFEKTIKAIENLKKVSNSASIPYKPFISVHIPLVKENYTYLKTISTFIISYGPDRVIFSFHHPDFSLRKAANLLRDALEMCTFGKVWSETRQVPPGLLTGYEHHISEFLRTEQNGYKKSSPCKTCFYDGICPGVPNKYFEIFGSKGYFPVNESSALPSMRNL